MLEAYDQQGVAMTCRGWDEYARMFDLRRADVSGLEVLDVAAGASSFVADAAAMGAQSVAVDPRYRMEQDRIYTEAKQEIETSTAKLARLTDRFNWSFYGNLARHRQMRLANLKRFDAHRRCAPEHYVDGQLPELPFPDQAFSLVLCSHFLFLYGEQLDFQFHERAIGELMRVCRTGGRVLIYPLVTLHFRQYDRLQALCTRLQSHRAYVCLKPARLPFIPGSTHYLSIQLE
ncbi:methyltransferase domain-containing protein [Paenibacillus sp. IB182496]|uniref:Methyltransferase domain-containing protein n=1 Tax=Paenibacillus sabuli TaxID=2772509 RepID=A0A927GS86_9BACL|nr:methyltransferase domain-containing protein [Paenibacillus sabuli]MBD2846031.1 methyltransferase domain-containing protein [Paenibacillus sabuli]